MASTLVQIIFKTKLHLSSLLLIWWLKTHNNLKFGPKKTIFWCLYVIECFCLVLLLFSIFFVNADRRVGMRIVDVILFSCGFLPHFFFVIVEMAENSSGNYCMLLFPINVIISRNGAAVRINHSADMNIAVLGSYFLFNILPLCSVKKILVVILK